MTNANYLSKQMIFMGLILSYLKINMILGILILLISTLVYFNENKPLQISIKGIIETAISYCIYLLWGAVLLYTKSINIAAKLIGIYIAGYFITEIIQEFKQYHFLKKHSQQLRKYCYSKYSIGKKIFQQVNIKNAKMYVVESIYLNAFCLDLFLLNKICIVITSELSKRTPNFIELTLMHEVGHLKNKHKKKQFTIILILNIFVGILTKIILLLIYANNLSINNILIAGFFYSIVMLIRELILHKLNRCNEYQADKFVLRNAKTAQEYIRLLKSINPFERKPTDSVNSLFADTPPIYTRIKQIELWRHLYIEKKQIL